MFRLPKNSVQSPSKKPSTSGTSSLKNQGLCKYSHRKCSLLALENYDYCLKHILEDRTAPYKPCPFLYTVSGKKCGKPAHRPDRKDTWFCAKHTRKAHLQRQRAQSKHAPPLTQETLLASLSHYARKEQPSNVKKDYSESEESEQPKSKAVNPFVEIDIAKVNARATQVLDYLSDSDSDAEPAMIDSVWRAQDHESSDAESVDSQAEDPLKHAGTYTAEEVTVIFKDKMLRLQSLYIDQFRRLQHVLKERRRKYLHSLKKEKETLCSIHDQEKSTAKEQKLYQKLKALNRYHKYHGVEAILHKKSLERRAQATEGHIVRTSHKGKCAFTEGGVKCGAKTLPVTKYCRKHILEDTQQVLFRACGHTRDDLTCKEPTLNVFENATCVYHIIMPPLPHNTLKQAEENNDAKTEKEPDPNSQNDDDMDTSLLDLGSDELKDILKPVEAAVKDILKPVADILSPSASTVDDILKQVASSVEEVMKPLDSSSVKLEETTSILDPSEAILSLESPKDGLDDAGVKHEPSSSQEQTDTEKETSENMDVVEDLVISPKEELTSENVDEDLVMVDIMTDVGVVEEVLDSESRPEQEEIIQDVKDNSTENG